MKRLIIAFALFAAASLGMNAGKTWQYKPSVSILGDSYSTFKGYVDPATNEMWYTVEDKEKRTDVHDVTQTWWWMFPFGTEQLLLRIHHILLRL